MKFSIKAKLSLGVGLQFFFIVVSVLAGLISVNFLTTDTRNILRANYDSLEYCRNIGIALEERDAKSLQTFSENLQKQQRNITEPSEKAHTDTLTADFAVFQSFPDSVEVQQRIRQLLNEITGLNLKAIQKKSEIAQQTGKTANIIMGTVGTLSFVFALILLVNLPHSVGEPIKRFTESIQQIANKNYAWRVDENRGDEFGEMAKSFNAMAAKLEEYESGNLAKMLFEKRRIEALINQMHNPVIGFNAEQVILFANNAALKILNLNSTQLLGRPANEVAVNNDLLRNLIVGLHPAELNAEIPTTAAAPLKIFADNKESYFEKEIVHVTVASTEGKGETFIGDVLILQNITQFKEQDAAKTHFIATVSHEFKTPISAIQMSLQLLKNEKIGTLNPEQTSLLASIENDAERLLKITGTLLDLSQVESGHISLNVLPVPIKEIVDYALGATRVQAEQKGIRMEITYADPQATVLADSEKTAWVLTNLISNAIRYSYEHSTVFLTTQLHNGRLRVSVRDTGQGIAPQYQSKVFERYFRVPGMRTEGTGLGLAISKEFIEAQGGKIGMESDFGSGSLFWVEVLVG